MPSRFARLQIGRRRSQNLFEKGNGRREPALLNVGNRCGIGLLHGLSLQRHERAAQR